MTSGVETSIENSADSMPSPASPGKYQTKANNYAKYKEYHDGYENNNDVKIAAAKGMMLGGSPAELYYKQLLAANVAALGKAAKMGFNTTNLYSSARGNADDKRPSTPEDETGSISSNEEADSNDNENMNQVSDGGTIMRKRIVVVLTLTYGKRCLVL